MKDLFSAMTPPVCLLAFWLLAAVAAADEEPGEDLSPRAPDNVAPNEPLKLSPAEAGFARSLSNASLVGGFTVSPPNRPDNQPPKVLAERYDLGEVRKVGDGRWLIPARVRYADRDVTLPITLPVHWAGDTAVIVVDQVGFPGLGVYSARVMIHGGRYAGYWSGGGHGGHLFGVITPQPPKPKTPAPAQP